MASYTISSITHHRDEAALTLLAHVTETSHGHTSKLSDITLRVSVLEDDIITRNDITAGTGIIITEGSEANTLEISIGQDVATTSDVIFNQITANSNVTINGELTVNGGSTYIYSTTKVIADPLIELASGNNANNFDIGFYGTYYSSSQKYHTGLVWDATVNSYKLFKNLTTAPTNNEFTFLNHNVASLEAYVIDISNHGINSLGDVDTTTNSPNIEQVLAWDGTKWVPRNQTTEVNDLTTSVTWTNVPDANITQSSVTQHQAALQITESQITDLQNYLTPSSLPTGSSGDVIISDGTGGIDSTNKLNVNPSNGFVSGDFINVNSANVKLSDGAGSGAGNDNISIGYQAGINAGNYAVAIGTIAGQSGGTNSVSLGFNAQANDNNCIVINGSGTLTQSLQTDSCYINPVRNVNATTLLSPYVVQYDDTNKEVIKSEDLHVRDITSRDINNTGTLTNVGTASLYNGQLTVGTTGNRAIVGAPNAILSVDLQNRKVGINVLNPTEDLDVDGNIQLNGATTTKIVFYDSNDDHEHAEIDATDDGANGGQLQFHTKVNNGAVSEKLRINNVGAIAVSNGAGGVTYGTSGQSLVSRGENNPVEWASTVPYHLVFGLNPNLGGIFRASHQTLTVINTLFVRTAESPTPTYDGDLTSSTFWSPSISGVFQINIIAAFRSVNNDYLVEDSIKFDKLISGSYVEQMDSLTRRWGSSVNEQDARVFQNHNATCGTIYATPSDTFRIRMYGSAYFGQDIWLLIPQSSFRVSITKVA